jgi:lysophospholipase L1-like esterase
MRYFLFLLILSAVALQNNPITIYLAGDSTMAEKLPEKRPETGWGEFVQQFFNKDSVRVENHARNGRSTRTFIEEHRWQAILDSLKSGDYVLIQFGHNDESKEKVDRYTPPEDYRKNLLMFIRTVREKNAHPILFTPVVRRRFDSLGVFYDTHGEYPDIVRAVAHESNVPLIDMQRKTRELLEHYGAEESKKLFLHVLPGESPNYPEGKEDNTHFSPLGAELVARLAIEGLREAHLDLVRYLADTPMKEPTQGR